MVYGKTMVWALSKNSFETSKCLIEGLVMALSELKDLTLELQNSAWLVVFVEEGSYDVIPCGDLFWWHTLKPLLSRINQ